MSHILKAQRIMSKRKTIDAFFKKKDVSNSEIRTLVVVETNVNTSMPNEQICERDRDPGTCKQICEFPINKQDEIRRAYLIEGLYQPKNIVYPYNDETYRRRFQPSWFVSHKDWLEFSPSMDALYCLPCVTTQPPQVCIPGCPCPDPVTKYLNSQFSQKKYLNSPV